MHKENSKLMGIMLITFIVVLFVVAYAPLAFAAGGAGEAGALIGLIVGFLAGTAVMFRIHWILGILTLVSGILVLAKTLRELGLG